MENNFPRCFNHFVICNLTMVDISLRVQGGSPVSDTHFKFSHRGKYSTPRLEVTFPRLLGEVGALGEHLTLIIF